MIIYSLRKQVLRETLMEILLLQLGRKSFLRKSMRLQRLNFMVWK
jgi:hypothetical protein